MAEIHKRAAEDAVEYSLFPVIPDGKNSSERRKVIEEYVRSFLTFLSPSLINVIWQNEGFNLVPVEEQGNCPCHLHGSTSYGDNIEDEWFIVYLLFQLTKHYSGLVAKVWDSDEEFLLIEAADVLPKWIKPETAENRVFIYNGHLHIIPIPQSPADIASFPHSFSSVGDAVECVRTYAEQTRASQEIQTAIQNRLKSFPNLMQESIHYTHCYIPASMAAILDERPQLVAPAVRAFYYRDPIDLQACRTFKYFRPGTRIMHRTKLTRCLYAQLVHQQFQPDKRSGWVLPSTTNTKYKSHDLGMKLAHGFEILCSKASESDSVESNGHTIPTNDVRWQKYVRSLKDRNYFRGEIEGSILYQELLDNAWKFYNENLIKKQSGAKEPGGEILNLMKTVKYDVEEMRLLEHTLIPPDDDSWLTLTPESLEQMLKSRGGNSQVRQDEVGEASFDLSKIADSMKKFIGNVSGLEGAEFPNAGEEDEDEDIQFDGSGFISAMQEMFEFEDESGSESSSDMSEYGWDNSSDTEPKTKTSKPRKKPKHPPSLDKYMDEMDKELAKSEVGKSFEKQGKSKPPAEPPKPSSKKRPSTCDVNDEDDDFQPVDIDLNTVKNLLQSYGAQEGLSGPASNILGSMGVFIPPDEDTLDSAVPSNQEKTVKSNTVRNEDTAPSVKSRGKPEPPPRANLSRKPESASFDESGRKPDRPPRPEAPPRTGQSPRSGQPQRPDRPPRPGQPPGVSAGRKPGILKTSRNQDLPDIVNSTRGPHTANADTKTSLSGVRSPTTPTTATTESPASVNSRRNSAPKKTRRVSDSSKETEV